MEPGPLSARPFAATLLGARLPGGIELVDRCNIRNVTVSPRKGWSARHVIDSLLAVIPDSQVTVSKAGVIDLASRTDEFRVLDVMLSEMMVPDRHNL